MRRVGNRAIMRDMSCPFGPLVPFSYPQVTKRLKDFSHLLVILFGTLGTKRVQNGVTKL